MAGASGTNLLLNMELQRQRLAKMKQELLADSKTSLDADYTALIADLQADQTTEQATSHVDTLVS